MLNNIVEKFCVDSLRDFYNNGNLEFVEYLDDNIIWYGPMEGQKIQGKANLIKAFSDRKNTLKFNIENLNTKLIPLKAEVFLLIATYELYTYYPGGKVVKYVQHVIIVCRRKKKNGEYQWVAPLIHVSDIISRDGKHETHPLYSEDFDKDIFDLIINSRGNVRKIVFSGKNNSNYYIAEDSIRYVEGGKGVRSYIHTKEGIYTVNHILKDVMRELPDYYYRCHSSYIINLKCVIKISNYRIVLDNGEEIPVPVKRYSQIKQEINELMVNI